MKLTIVFVLLFFVILSCGCASYTYVTYKNQERNAFLQQTDSSPFQMFDVRGMYFFAYVSEMHYYEEHYYVAGIHIYPYPYPLDTFQVTVENLVISDSNGNKLFTMEESLLINHINSYVQSYDYTDINYDHGSVPFITKVPLEVFEEQHDKYFVTFEVDGKHMCQTLVKDAKTFVYPTYKGRIIEGW